MNIPLTQGKETLIDDADYPLIAGKSWSLSKGGYAARGMRVNGKNKSVFMHRVILGLTEPGLMIDHINGDPLDNRRCNLRACTCSQNQQNRRARRNKKHSPFKGVTFDKKQRKWKAGIVVDGRRRHLGVFPTPEVAARAYDAAARKFFGEFAHPNFS